MPAAMRYQGELASTAASLTAIGMEPDTALLEAVTAALASLSSGIAALEAALAHEGGSTYEGAKHACADLLPAMLTVRAAADELETLVADDLWPLPTYQEMLFIL